MYELEARHWPSETNISSGEQRIALANKAFKQAKCKNVHTCLQSFEWEVVCQNC